MQKWFEAGLFRGAREIRQGLKDPRPFVQTIEPAQQQQVATNLLARWYFLLQEGPAAAWSRAEGMTHFMYTAPNRPATGPVAAAPPAAAPPAARTWQIGARAGKQ